MKFLDASKTKEAMFWQNKYFILGNSLNGGDIFQRLDSFQGSDDQKIFFGPFKCVYVPCVSSRMIGKFFTLST